MIDAKRYTVIEKNNNEQSYNRANYFFFSSLFFSLLKGKKETKMAKTNKVGKKLADTWIRNCGT